MSSTYSQMINVIEQDFKINTEILRQDFYSKENKEKENGTLARSQE